jgi:glucosylceramidase
MRCLFILLLVGASSAFAADPVAHEWISSADGKQKLERLPPIPMGGVPTGGITIHVDASRPYQPIEGFGAAFTDSSAYLMNRKMSATQRADLMRELFDPKNGVGLSVVRVPIGASDFSLSHYSFDNMPPGKKDPKLAHFSIEHARADVLPMLREALAINPGLKVFVSPWSPPAWMKDTDNLVKGRLDPKYYAAYSNYFDKTLAAFKAEGVPVHALTIQNEPHFEPPDYPGMRMEPGARAEFIRDHLGPMLKKKWPAVKLLDWDHNWDQPESPLAVLADAKARPFVAGIAWHCYNGDVKAQSSTRASYPDKETWMTECSGGNWAPDWGGSLDWMTQNLVIGNVRNWGRGAILWNLALDETSGPHAGGCGDCRGVVTIDSRSGAVTRNVEYYVLAHVSRFVKAQAHRIESDSGVDDLHTAAFQNLDKSIALVAVNAGRAERVFSVVEGARSFPVTLPAGSVATFFWRPSRSSTSNATR